MVPEFSSIVIDEGTPGSVCFNCTVSSMSQLVEYGLYFTTATSSKPSDSPWTKVGGTRLSDDSFSARIDGLLGGATYDCRLYIGNGRVERLSDPFSYFAPDNGSGRPPMMLRVCPGKSGAVCLPLRGSVKCVIDWGDGAIEAYNEYFGLGTLADGYISHSYADFSHEYEISVSGNVTALSSYGLPEDSISAILDWGETGLEDMSCAFMDCHRLESLAAPGPDTFAAVQSFRKAFAACVSLRELPDGLFSFGEDFQQCFKGCTSLSSLPAILFGNGVTARELNETFMSCSALEAIPGTLFSHFTGLERMVSTFSGCRSLKSLPAELFDSNRALTCMEGVFMNCQALKGESPYTTVEGKKIHLYERGSLPDLFAPIERSALCFFGCMGLADFDNIPDNWKRP